MATTDLGKWMITDGGEYDASKTYDQLTMVHFENSTYITLKDNVQGITPTNDGVNYILMAQGFDATALSSVNASDTQGLLGTENAENVNAQELINAIADRVVNKLLEKTDVVDQVVNDATKAISASAVYALQQKLGTGNLPDGMSDVVSGLSTLNSNLTDLVMVKSFSSDIITVGTSATAWKIAYTIPDGYTPIAWSLAYGNSSEIILASEETYNTNMAAVSGFARSVNTQHDIKIRVTVTFVKKQYL